MAQCRHFRAAALQNGLDPDTALPEDILNLSVDSDGNLLVNQEYERSLKAYEYEQKQRIAGIYK